MPRPFKNPEYRKNVNRRNKTLKQILAQERERIDKLAKDQRELDEAARAAGTDAMDVDGAPKRINFAELVTCTSAACPALRAETADRRRAYRLVRRGPTFAPASKEVLRCHRSRGVHPRCRAFVPLARMRRPSCEPPC